MSDAPDADANALKNRTLAQVRAGQYRITAHAHQEMVSDGFQLDDVLAGLENSRLLENYPEHKRGACALFGGVAPDGRPIHIVCTTANPVTILITVYEPKPPKWPTPTQRNR